MQKFLFVIVFSWLAASVGHAAEYYFLSSTNSKFFLWSSSGECRGSGCQVVGTCSGTNMYGSASTMRVATDMYNDGASIFIRENWSPYDVVCTWKKN